MVSAFALFLLLTASMAASFSPPRCISLRRKILNPPKSLPTYSLSQRQHQQHQRHHQYHHLHHLRGGSGLELSPSSLLELAAFPFQSPTTTFQAALVTILTSVVFLTRVSPSADKDNTSSSSGSVAVPKSVSNLRKKFLPVFWLLRLSDWLQGPYFFAVYSTKVLSTGVAPSLQTVSLLFLTGFASTAAFGPLVGRASDVYGRKLATLIFTFVYAAGALTTKSNVLSILLLGRVVSGVGTALLMSAPESWLVSESLGDPETAGSIGETFGKAYAGDSVVAIAAGLMAGKMEQIRGVTGPFELSAGVLGVAALALLGGVWGENRGGDGGEKNKKLSIRDAATVVKKDEKILLVGMMQALFEAAMYIFVLQWPPIVSQAIGLSYASSPATPYGLVFSCFMACCLLGSSIFSRLETNGKNDVEGRTATALSLAAIAMVVATGVSTMTTVTGPTALIGACASFFAFETIVGMYFPSIGTLRSKYLPDEYRSVIMNLFGIPLNALVVGVFLGIKFLGVTGALGVASTALAGAAFCGRRLRLITQNNSEE